MAKTLEYKQLTVRLPPRIFKLINDFSRFWGLSIQDAIVIVLWDYFSGGKSDDSEG